MSPLIAFAYAWLIVSAGTLCFLGSLVLSAFRTGGIARFRRLNISLPALWAIVVIMSLLFPIAWYMIYKLIKETRP